MVTKFIYLIYPLFSSHFPDFSSSFRLVKNLSRRQEGFIAAASLQLILSDSSLGHSTRLGGKEMDSQDCNITLSHRTSSL